MRVGGRHGWRITAEHRPAIGEPLKFVSHRLWEDPNAGFKVGDGVTVYHLPFEPGACAFDLEAAPDRLEKPA